MSSCTIAPFVVSCSPVSYLTFARRNLKENVHIKELWHHLPAEPVAVPNYRHHSYVTKIYKGSESKGCHDHLQILSEQRRRLALCTARSMLMNLDEFQDAGLQMMFDGDSVGTWNSGPSRVVGSIGFSGY